MLNKIVVSYCVKWTRNLKMVNYFHTKACSDSMKVEPLLTMDFESRYDRQMIDKVLDVLNTKNVTELTRYNITKRCLQQMEKYRKKNGPFKSIDQVLEVESFGTTNLEKFVVSIIGETTKNKKNVHEMSALLRNLVTPVLDNTKKSSIGTVTSIYIGVKHISWAHMESNGRLLSWNSYESFEWPKNDDTMYLHNVALQVRKKLPISDIYVTEEVDTRSSGGTQLYTLSMNLQRLQLTTMLVALIATKFDQSDENGSHWTQINNYYLLRRKVTGQLFHLVVGGENVSADTVINQMINKNVAEQFQHILPVKIDFLGLETYEKSNPWKKEALSQALLLSIAFIDLVLHCNPVSLKSLTFRKRDRLYA